MVVEQEYNIPIRRGDRVSVPGGARALSYYDIEKIESLDLASIFKASALAQIGIYLSHGAKTLFLVNHNDCGFSPEFDDKAKEEKWHIDCLVAGQEVIKEYISSPIKGIDYSDTEIVMMYVIVDPETDYFEEAKLVNIDGETIAEFTLPKEKC